MFAGGSSGEVQISVLRRGTQTRIPNGRVLNSDPALMRLRLFKKNADKPRLSKNSKASVAELLRLRMVKKSPKKQDPRTSASTASGNPTQSLRLRMFKKSKDVENRKRLMKLFKTLPVFKN